MTTAKTVAGFRIDFELSLAESLQSRDCLGKCVHRNRYNFNEKKTCKIMCERETSADRAMEEANEMKEPTECAEPAECAGPAESIESKESIETTKLMDQNDSGNESQQETSGSVEEAVGGVDDSEDDDSVGGLTTENDPTENDPLYAPYFKRLRIGHPLELLKSEMEAKGLDSEVLDDQPQEETVIYEYLMSSDGTEIWSSVTEFLTKCKWESSEDPACNNCNEQRTSVLNVASIVRATVRCGDCDEYYCTTCFDSIHSGGKRKLHEITWKSGGKSDGSDGDGSDGKSGGSGGNGSGEGDLPVAGRDNFRENDKDDGKEGGKNDGRDNGKENGEEDDEEDETNPDVHATVEV